MAVSQLQRVVRRLHGIALGPIADGATDSDLLQRFVRETDGPAFAALVRRHGALVWGVCQRVLMNRADAEDAFQATFVVLVRKASSLRRPEALGNWLYGVAFRTALEARRARARRRRKEAMAMATMATRETPSGDLRAVLDQELAVLADKYREVVVLCDLEGKTRKEAAQVLHCAEGTVASRLSRGRSLLAKRLSRRGLSLSAGALARLVAESASAAVPVSVVTNTVQAALVIATGPAALSALSAPVASLVNGVLKTMLLTKFKIAVAIVLAAALGCCGIAALTSQAAGQAEPVSDIKRPAVSARTSASSANEQEEIPAKTIQQTLLDATKSADDIPEPYERVQALGRVGLVQARTGAKEVAKKTFQKAVAAARLLPTETFKQADQRWDLLFQTAGLLAFAHDWAGAHDLVDDILANDSLPQHGGVPLHRLYSFELQLAHCQADAGWIDEAIKTAQAATNPAGRSYIHGMRALARAKEMDWPQALEFAGLIENAGERVDALAKIGVLQHKAGRKDEARQSLQQARKLLDDDKPGGDGRYRLTLARAHVDLGDCAEGIRLAESVKNTSNIYPERECGLAILYCDMGDLPNGLKYARMAREISAQQEGDFRPIAAAYARAKKYPEAFAVANEIKDGAFHAQALMDIAAAQHRAGLKDESAQTFRLAVQTAETAPVPERGFAFFNHAGLFGQIAQVQAELGEAAAARVWIGRQIAAKNQAYALAGLAEGLHTRMQVKVAK